jgi:hypothetical protein
MLSGGNGDDTLDGDIGDENGPALDRSPNSGTCNGGNGKNTFFYCEIESSGGRGPGGNATGAPPGTIGR